MPAAEEPDDAADGDECPRRSVSESPVSVASEDTSSFSKSKNLTLSLSGCVWYR